MQTPIYLDYNSTTPVDIEVFEAMKPYFLENFGNPSSKTHSYGWVADKAVQTARKQIASLIGSETKEIIFTSGATESNNLALRGVFESYGFEGAHIVSTTTEHKSVMETLEYLETKGAKITLLPVDQFGQVSAEQVQESLTENTILVSVIFGNNEIGTLNDIKEIGNLTFAKGILLHTDAVQALGRLDMKVNDLKVDLMSFSSHKIYGPKGIGGLYVRQIPERVKIKKILFGGEQEMGLRPGTLNVPAIVGFGKACQLLQQNFHEENFAIKELQTLFINELLKLPNTKLNGHPTKRLNNNVSVRFEGVKNFELIKHLKNVACSTGAACSSDLARVSHVLDAIGLNLDQIQSTIRFSFGRFSKSADIIYVVDKIKDYLISPQNSQTL